MLVKIGLKKGGRGYRWTPRGREAEGIASGANTTAEPYPPTVICPTF